MTLVAAIVVTALVVGLGVSLFVRRTVTARITNQIGGRPGLDPVAEHRRLLHAAEQDAATSAERVELLQLSLEALTSGVLVTDRVGKVLIRNAVATTITSQSHEQALIDAATTELLQRAVRGQSGDRELNVFGPPPKTLVVHSVPIAADGQIFGAIAVIDDVTDHHRIEKTRRDFVANLSHELRTPVGAASLLGEMLVDEADPIVRQQLTDRLLVETDRMSETIDDLLALSRIESTEQSYDERVEIRGLIEEALARTRVAAETSEIDVGSIVPADELVIDGNRDQLLTALVNLVENAIKYSSPGDSVSVRTRADADALHLVVQDTGRGIPARDLDRVFERFYRVDRARDSATGGTGSGLSIVRHVALNHGGTVKATSYEGEGSTFTMVLPRRVSNPSSATEKHEVR